GRAPGIDDPRLDPLGKLQEMAIARRQVAAGLRDADDRAGALRLLARQAVVEMALEVERGLVGMGAVWEPELAEGPRAFGVGRPAPVAMRYPASGSSGWDGRDVCLYPAPATALSKRGRCRCQGSPRSASA